MGGGAIIIHRQNKFMRAFHAAGAVSADGARTLAEVGVRRSWIFDRMASRGVFVCVGGDRWYLDEGQAAQFVLSRRNRIVGMLVAAGVIIFLLFILRAR